MPALLIATSRLPHVSTASATAAPTSSSRVTSVWTYLASVPAASQSATVPAPPSSSTSAITSLAPRPARMRAAARPSPDPPPVIRATLPAKSCISLATGAFWPFRGLTRAPISRTVAKTVDRRPEAGSSPKDVGRQLRHVRRKQGLSRSEVARSAGLTRRELAAYERGRVDIPESDLWCLAGSCGVDVGELLPHRDKLRVDSDLSALAIGDTIRHLRSPGEHNGLLNEYLSMIYELRNLPPGTRVPLREEDLNTLADALGGSPDVIESRLCELIGANREEAARLRAMILPPLSLPAPGASDAGPDDFFATPRASDPFAPPPPLELPPDAMPPTPPPAAEPQAAAGPRAAMDAPPVMDPSGPVMEPMPVAPPPVADPTEPPIGVPVEHDPTDPLGALPVDPFTLPVGEPDPLAVLRADPF